MGCEYSGCVLMIVAKYKVCILAVSILVVHFCCTLNFLASLLIKSESSRYGSKVR